MAENWTLAFGRYLRELRERRGLSLNEVATLSQAFADDVQKGYLSRVENGRQRLAFSKVIALSRIYEVPAGVLLERMELDLELQRIGGPETEGLDFETLRVAGKQAMAEGSYWDAYAYMRDACPIAGEGDVVEPYESHDEQQLLARINVATAAIQIGRYRFVLHEIDHVEKVCAIREQLQVLVLERKSVVLRHLSRNDEAWEYACRAIEIGERSPANRTYLGFAYFVAAILSNSRGDVKEAAALYQSAHTEFASDDRRVEMARCLGNLGQVYFDQQNYRAAKRSLSAAEKQYSELGMRHSIALQRIMLGIIDELEGHDDAAEQHWREASRIAKELNSRGIEFKANLHLLKLADAQHKPATAKALARRLRQLANWLPRPSADLDSFDRYLSQRGSILSASESG